MEARHDDEAALLRPEPKVTFVIPAGFALPVGGIPAGSIMPVKFDDKVAGLPRKASTLTIKMRRLPARRGGWGILVQWLQGGQSTAGGT